MLHAGLLQRPCGLYVEPIPLEERTDKIEFQPASDDSKQRMVGLRMSYLFFGLILLFDPDCTYGPDTAKAKTYRPTYLMARNSKRTHTVMLTWPPTISKLREVVMIGR